MPPNSSSKDVQSFIQYAITAHGVFGYPAPPTSVMHPELKNTWTPAVNVLTWFMLVTAILSVLTRLGTKYFFFRKFTFDDGLAASSIVFCVAESIAVSMATANGLGQHYKMLAETKVDNMMKVWDLLWLLP